MAPSKREIVHGDDDSNVQKIALIEHELDDDEKSCPDSASESHSLVQHGTTIHAVAACSLYSCCSVSMVLVNKSLAGSYNHLIGRDLNILLVVFQAVVAVICVETCKRLKLVDYPNLSFQTAKAWAPVNIFFCFMLFTGMASLQTNSVPMVTIFKNVSNILTAFGEYAFFGNRPDVLILAAFAVMLTGAIAAAKNDISITSSGLFWMLANCLSTSGYVLYMKFATQHIAISKFGMVMVNNVLCVAFLLPAAFLMGEVSVFMSTDAIHTVDYFAKNVFAGFVGFFLNFASLSCVGATSPSTYSIIGSLNKIPASLLGYFIFDSAISHKQWFFIAFSLCGGFLFSFAKIQAAARKKTG